MKHNPSYIVRAALPKTPRGWNGSSVCMMPRQTSERRAWFVPSPGRLRLAILLGLLTAIVCVWTLTPLDQLTDTGRMLDLARDWAAVWWAPLAVALAYLVAGMVVFPFTIMIAVTGLLYGAWWGFLLAVSAGLFAACVMFYLGRFLGRDIIGRHGGTTINRLSQSMGRNGVTTIAVLRMTPVASFGAINLMAGASHIRFGDYFIGTLVGMVPYAFAVSLFGDVLERVLRDPSVEGALLLVAAFVGILMLALILDGAIRRYRRRKDDGAAELADVDV